MGPSWLGEISLVLIVQWESAITQEVPSTHHAICLVYLCVYVMLKSGSKAERCKERAWGVGMERLGLSPNAVLPGCVTSGRWLNFSELQFPHLYNETVTATSQGC